MILSFFQLKNLPVFTQSGFKLGQVSDFEIDTEAQSILRYIVTRGKLVGRFQPPLLIHRQQVISVSSEKMVVEDAVVKELELAKKEKEILPQTAPSGVSVRQF